MPIPGLEKLCDGKIHVLKWKNKICYLSVEKVNGPGYYNYTVSVSREKSPDLADFSGNYRKHVVLGVDSRFDFTKISKSRVVIYKTSAFQRYGFIFDFNPETNGLIKVVAKCGYRPFYPTVMTGCPVDGKDAKQIMEKAVFKEMYKD